MKRYIHFILTGISFILFYVSCSLPEPEDIDPPIVSILYPQSGMTLRDSVSVIVESSDNETIKQVRCYLDDQQIGISSNQNSRFNINLTEYADNNIHIISASAIDDAGNVGVADQSVSVIISDGIDRILPVVHLIYPVSGEIPKDTIELIVDASDNEELSRVVFFINGDSVFSVDASTHSSPYQYSWDTTPYNTDSQHSIYIKAVDQSGNESYTSTIVVTIIDTDLQPVDLIPPTVILLYPEIGITLSDVINVRVDVYDNVQVDSVQFFVDGEKEITDSDGMPWGFAWDTSNIADSLTHTLYIKAFDLSGNIGTQGPLSFTIVP